MKLPPELITVTPLSKTVAIIVFFTLPVIGFFAGVRYQQAIQIPVTNFDSNEATSSPSTTPTPTPTPTLTLIPSVTSDFYKLPIKTSYCLAGPQRVGITLTDGSFVMKNADGTYTRYSSSGNKCL